MAEKKEARASKFLGVDIDGTARSLKDYPSDYLLLSFWASWCAPCREELPQLLELEQKYGAQDLKILALNTHDDYAAALEFIDELGLDLEYLFDLDGRVAQNFKINPLPANLLVENKTRNILGRWEGKADFERLKEELKNKFSP